MITIVISTFPLIIQINSIISLARISRHYLTNEAENKKKTERERENSSKLVCVFVKISTRAVSYQALITNCMLLTNYSLLG